MMKTTTPLALLALLALATAGCTGSDGDNTDSPVVINEFTSSDDDAVELYNRSDADVDLSGWILTDDAFVMAHYDSTADEEKYVFPTGTVLAPGQYLLLTKGDGEDQHPFGIKSGGETLTLINADGDKMDQVTYQTDQAVDSFCRVPDGGDDWQTCAATFGDANAL